MIILTKIYWLLLYIDYFIQQPLEALLSLLTLRKLFKHTLNNLSKVIQLLDQNQVLAWQSDQTSKPCFILPLSNSLEHVLSHFSHAWLFATARLLCPWDSLGKKTGMGCPTLCYRQAPLSMGFSRQENWNGLPCPPPGDHPDPGIEPMSLMSPALAGEFFTLSHQGSPLGI